MFTFKRLKRLNSLLLLVLAYCISMPGLLAAVAFYLLTLMSFGFHGPNGHMQLKWCMPSRQGNAHLNHLIWSFVCCKIGHIWSYLYWSLEWTPMTSHNIQNNPQHPVSWLKNRFTEVKFTAYRPFPTCGSCYCLQMIHWLQWSLQSSAEYRRWKKLKEIGPNNNNNNNKRRRKRKRKKQQ